MITIHPSAIVAKEAILGEGSSVGAYSIIGPDVVLGKNTRVGPHVVIEGRTTFGNDNQIFQFASVGSAPQDLKFKGEASTLEIGDRNIIREYVTLQPGTSGGGMRTVIGSGNLFMACSHVGHDGIVGSNNVFANSAALAGHVTVGSGVIVGGLAAVHQFVRLGDLCILGGGSIVTKDIPPFCMAQGDRAALIGLNHVGLSRAKFVNEDITKLRALYRSVFLGKGTLSSRIESAAAQIAGFAAGEKFLEFIRTAEKGVSFPRKKGLQVSDSDT